jgi:hypothetical protein
MLVVTPEHPAGRPFHEYVRPAEPPLGTELVNMTDFQPKSLEVAFAVGAPTVRSL